MRATPRRLVPLAALLLAPLTGCDDVGTPDPTAPDGAARAAAVSEAAAVTVLPFEAQGTIDGRMSGSVRFSGGAAELSITVVDSRAVGDVLQVEQVWEIHPPDPIEPFELRLQGVVDRSGVVLNGSAAAGPAHVRAELAGTTLKGDLSIVGFNPQPEPPAVRSVAFDRAADELARARAGTAAFQRLAAAADAGYEQVTPCIAAPPGAMGYHFVRGDLYGDGAVDATRPEALLYAPSPSGQLRLVGVEYQVFAFAWDPANPDPPSLFGETFEDHRAEGTTHGLPPHYELHAWIWRHNPAGMFAPFNPEVSC